jgi:hypothetical protein
MKRTARDRLEAGEGDPSAELFRVTGGQEERDDREWSAKFDAAHGTRDGRRRNWSALMAELDRKPVKRNG